MLRHVLLALLSNDQPAHGYALMKGYTERMGVRLSIGNVYRELQRLVAEGLIFTAANPPGADPRRAPYGLTERGREALSAWLVAPVEGPGRSIGEEIAFRLAVLGDLEWRVAGPVLERLRAELWGIAKRIEQERAEPSNGNASGRLFRIRETLLRRRAMQLATDIELIDEISASVAPPQPETVLEVGETTVRRPLRRSRPRTREGDALP